LLVCPHDRQSCPLLVVVKCLPPAITVAIASHENTTPRFRCANTVLASEGNPILEQLRWKRYTQARCVAEALLHRARADLVEQPRISQLT
jgi:hypothetical protein